MAVCAFPLALELIQVWRTGLSLLGFLEKWNKSRFRANQNIERTPKFVPCIDQSYTIILVSYGVYLYIVSSFVVHVHIMTLSMQFRAFMRVSLDMYENTHYD